MKKAVFLTSTLLLASFFVVLAGSNDLPKPTPDDLLAAGYTVVKIIETDGDRYSGPVKYFRVAEKPQKIDPKKDCADCNDLVAVYIGKTNTIPAWVINQSDPIRIIGNRFQTRIYSPNKKTVIAVTGPIRERVIKLTQIYIEKLN